MWTRNEIGEILWPAKVRILHIIALKNLNRNQFLIHAACVGHVTLFRQVLDIF